MQKKKQMIVLIIPLLLLLMRLNINTTLAWYETPVQSETLFDAAILGTTTEYGYEGPAAERYPQFYSGLIADGGPGTIFGFVYPELVKIEVTGMDPLGNTLTGDRFSAFTILSSPDDSGVEQRILKTVFDIIIHLGPSPIRAIAKNTLTEGGATTGWDPQKAWGVWQRPWYGIPNEERGLRFGYKLVVDPAIEGTYTISVHYHAWIASYDGINIHHVGFIDLYDTVYYEYVNTPLAPSTPSGSTSGSTGTEYSYTTSTTDPNGDSLRYEFDWGDGSTMLTDLWYTSGATASASHTWASPETYYVKVRAKDSTGAWSSWSQSLTVTIEPSFVTILNELGFTNIEESAEETFSRGIYDVKLYAEFAGYHEFNNLSWYPVGTTEYNLIFSGSDGNHGYIEPPTTKTFTANVEFGLSFHSPEARYFTETDENPDGIKHAEVYVNLDNPDMFLIGFENLLGVEDKDYNDMVISLEIINKPPNTPSIPSGYASGYTDTSYIYSTDTIDPDGDDVYYLFDWDDGSTITIGPYVSGAAVSASHTWSSTGTYNVNVKAKDSYGVWSDFSSPLTVSISSGGGGCPTLFSWNGTDFTVDNNLLPKSARSNGTEVEDYYRLEQNLVPIYEGYFNSYYSLKISEFQQEHSYFDQVQLFVVDHQANVSVAVSPTGEILTFQNPYAPVIAVDEANVSWLDELSEIDGEYYESYNGSFLVLNFGEVNGQDAKLVFRADPPGDTKRSIYIQVLNSSESWVDVASIIPRTYWATDIIDLSDYLPSDGDLVVRLYFTDNHRVDFVGLDATPQAEIDVEDANLLWAYHSEEGTVTAELSSDDDVYAELVPDQQITLLFRAPNPDAEARTFIFYVKGYYYTITG